MPAKKITPGTKAAAAKAAKPKAQPAPKAEVKKAIAKPEMTAEEHIQAAIDIIGKEKIYSKGNNTTQVIHGLTRSLDKLKKLKQMIG